MKWQDRYIPRFYLDEKRMERQVGELDDSRGGCNGFRFRNEVNGFGVRERRVQRRRAVFINGDNARTGDRAGAGSYILVIGAVLDKIAVDGIVRRVENSVQQWR